MDASFLEFWAGFLTSAAKGQRQIEEASDWMRQGLTGFDDLTALFCRAYGLDGVSVKNPDYPELWDQAAKMFKKSMNEYLSLFGVVPAKEHHDLVEKYEELKEKVASQEETIKHLRMLLEGKGVGQEELQRSMQELVTRQTEQFKELMQRLGFLSVKTP